MVDKQVYKDAKEKLEKKVVSPDKYQPALEQKHQPPNNEAADIAQKAREGFEKRQDQLDTPQQEREEARKALEEKLQRIAVEERARTAREPRER